MVRRALLNIATWFTENYAKQGRKDQALHMHRNEEEMAQLEKAMETAFDQFRVR
jgi:hypothetical protein